MTTRRCLSGAAVACLLFLLALAGCYRHTVRESGPGGRDDIYEPNVAEEGDAASGEGAKPR